MFFIDHASSFDRNGIYGEAGADYPDNARRFALFSLAALHALPRLAPGVRSCKRTTGTRRSLLPRYPHPRWGLKTGRPLTVFSVHNAGFQGSFAPETIVTWDSTMSCTTRAYSNLMAV